MGFLIPIDDGFTLTGKLPARPGLHEEALFKYRPALPQRVTEYLRADKGTAAKEMANDVKLLLEHLVSWTISEGDGVAAIDERTLRRVYHSDLQVLLNHVTSYASTAWEQAEKNSSSD